ncbi:hypothetical protein ES703_41405 [subsurface metagenome]
MPVALGVTAKLTAPSVKLPVEVTTPFNCASVPSARICPWASTASMEIKDCTPRSTSPGLTVAVASSMLTVATTIQVALSSDTSKVMLAVSPTSKL